VTGGDAVPGRAQSRPEPPCVLHVSRPAVGGLRKHLETLLPRLTEGGWNVCLAAPAGLTGGGGSPLAAFRSFPVEISDRPGLVEDLRAALQLRRAVRGSGASLVHCHGIRAAWVARLAAFPQPRAVTVHNLFRLPEGRLKARLARSALDAEALIAVSAAVRSSLVQSGIPPDRVCIIPNGIEPPEPVPAEDVSTFRGRLGLEGSRPLVACVARLMPDKGVDVLIEAWRLAAPRLPGAALVIAGDGPDRRALEDAAAGVPRLRFAGHLPDVRPLYAAADILVIPSRREGQSIVCLEAALSQPPPALVVTSAGGLPEMVRHAESGLVVPPEDPAALADAVVCLAEDGEMRDRLSRSAAGMARRRFSAGRMASATLELYGRIATGAPGSGKIRSSGL